MKTRIDKCRFFIFLIIFVSLYFFVLQLVNPNFFLYDDNLTYYLPSYKFNWHAVFHHKSIPLINFHQYLGQTYLTQLQCGFFYPFVYFAVFISKALSRDYFYVIDVLVYMHLVLGSVSFYFLLRQFEIEKIISAFSSLIWVTLPFFIIMARAWVFVSYMLFLFPLAFLFFLRLIKNLRFSDIVVSALVQSLFFFQGYVQYLFIYFIFESFYLLLYLIYLKFYAKRRLNELLILFYKYVLSKIIFCLIILPMLLPALEGVRGSAFRGTDTNYGDFISNSLYIFVFLYSQIFYFVKDVAWQVDSEIYYSGLIFILIIFGIYGVCRSKVKDSQKKYLFIFPILCLLAFLLSTELHSYLYNLPVFNKFRWPFKYYAIFLFFMMILFSLCFDAVYKKMENKRIYLMILFVLFLASNIFVVLYRPYNLTHTYKFEEETKVINSKISADGRISTLSNEINIKETSRYLGHNFATFYGKYHFAGYDPLVSDQNYRLSLGLNFFSNFREKIDLSKFNYLSQWSVKYFISYRHKNFFEEGIIDKLNLIYEDEEIKLFENPESLPFAFYVDENLKYKEYLDKSPILNFGLNSVEVKNNPENTGMMIVNIAPLKKYRFYVDGKKQDIRINKYESKLVLRFPKDSKEIKIVYFDMKFIVGSVVSLTTLIIISLLMVLRRKKKIPI